MKSKKANAGLPLRSFMCATCPFRAGSPYAELAPSLAISAITESTRICHSTGANNAINHRTGKPPAVCRGARDVALNHFHNIGFIEAATDAAWNKKFEQLQDRKKKPTTN
jgi:hypothetical protein